MNSARFSDETRILLLRKHDPLRPWRTLDDPRVCIACGRELTGRSIRISGGPAQPNFTCPAPGCSAGLAEFAAPGDPLLDDEVWRDWERTLAVTEDGDEGEESHGGAQ